MSISALSQSAVEEKIKWRQDENDIDGETATATAKSSSPTSVAAVLSRNSSRLGQNQQIYSPNTGKKAKGPVVNYYVVLEKSPPRVSNDESDTSTYDRSFHGRETDFCQDSTDAESSSGDDDSFATEGMTNIDYLEYEVASASDDDADSVLNSSSGTDDHGLVMSAAVVGSLDTTSSNSDFADSEESDSDKLFDKELSEADFWECIQCRNPNNNPLYPMCEKCYKIRRTHFPPRPKPRKKKFNRHRKSTVAANGAVIEKLSSDVSVSASQDGEMSKRLCSEVMGNEGFNANTTSGYNSFKRRKLNYTNNDSQLNSAAETSDEDSRERKSPYNRFRRETVSTNLSSSGRSSLNVNNRLATTSVNRKRSSPGSREKEVWQAKKRYLENSKTLSSADTECDTDHESITLLARNISQKDSGVSSAPSSQEPQLSSYSDEKSVEKDDELIKPMNGSLRDNTVRAQVVGMLKQSDDLARENLFSGIKHSNIIRSVSDITNPLNNNLSSDAFSINSLDPSFSTYGSCTMCFSGPKNGVFVHTNNVHLCSCYKCAVRIWSKDKKCPVCNVSAKNVLKLFVH